MGSSIKSPFLLPSVLIYIVHQTLSGRMTFKVIVVLCLVLVGLIEANPVSMEASELLDGELYKTSDIGFTPNSNESEDINEDGDNGNDFDQDGDALERKKRSPVGNDYSLERK